jgi:hypothetical protein
MSRRNTSPNPEWDVHSAFVPKRDGRQRVEAAIRLLLDPPTDPLPPTDRRTDHAGGHLRQSLDPAPGARPDD